MEFRPNPPDATALMMSARSFGNYDLAGALSDLIDNSIKALSKNISLTCYYNGGDPEIRVIDDGYGMSPGELYDAMRPASTNPLDERSPDDLGRFGWGMKSASFSQCSCLTVISRKDGKKAGAVWDLDNIDKWQMGVLSQEEIESFGSEELNDKDGTEVIWTKCDRLSEHGQISQAQFNELIVQARDKISLVFHRYLAGAVSKKKLVIILNGDKIPVVDPFYTSHEATQTLESEPLDVGSDKQIIVQPFILPHYSKLKNNELEKMSGDEGLLRNQGFYVYRNDRLIIYGTWFRLVKHGELSQLIRISVDIPNTLDDMWKITVDKSDAQLPSALKKRLKQIVSGLRKRSSNVYRSKGGKIASDGKVSVWTRYAKHGEIRYEINREHPLLDVLYEADEDSGRNVDLALRAIEQGFPVTAFGKDAAASLDAIHQTESDPQKFKDFLDSALPKLLLDCEGCISKLVEKVKIIEPFSSNWILVEDYLTTEGWISEET